MRRGGVIVIVALLAAAAAAAGSPPPLSQAKPPYTPEELVRLERGEVVFKHEEKKISETEQSSLLVGSVLITQPLDVLWEVLDHPEREKEWFPYVKVSNVVRDERPTPTTRINTTDYRITGMGIEVYYSLERHYDYKAGAITAVMDKKRPHKFFTDIHAWWNFFPHKNGVIFQYTSDSKLVINLPRVVSESFAEKQMASGIGELKKRCDVIAEERRKRSP